MPHDDTTPQLFTVHAPTPPPRPHQQLWDAIRIACNVALPVTARQGADIGKTAKELAAVGATAADVERFAGNWRRCWSKDITPDGIARHWGRSWQPATDDRRRDTTSVEVTDDDLARLNREWQEADEQRRRKYGTTT